jgi:hypothetical protein
MIVICKLTSTGISGTEVGGQNSSLDDGLLNIVLLVFIAGLGKAKKLMMVRP